MKLLTAFLLASVFANDIPYLSGTTWIEVSESDNKVSVDCPIILSFEVVKYQYINECSGKGKNKIVEYGTYVLEPSSMWLENRMVVVGAGSILGEDANPVLIESVRVDGQIMTINVGDIVLIFRRQK